MIEATDKQCNQVGHEVRRRVNPLSLAAAKVHVGKSQELIPIEGGDRMLAGTNVIRDGMHDRLVERRHLTGPKILPAQLPIDRASSNTCEELTLGIAPAIVVGARNIYGAGSDQGNQFVGIDGKLVDMIRIFLEVGTEPVRKRVDKMGDSFSIVAPRQ